MIELLRIQGLAIVESAELEFGSGLNVLTGETGAGKSIVLGALGLIAGGRASAGDLREGADEAAVEAIFRTSGLPELEAALAERGLDVGEDEDLVVRRTLSRSGRSRARAMGQMVPVGVLGELFSGRIEVSSQHSSQALLQVEQHGRFLDAAGGLLKERGLVEEGYASMCRIDAELARLRAESDERTRRRDFLSFQVGEIDEAEIESGELARLDAEHVRLAHADSLKADGGNALLALRGDAMGEGASSALDGVRSALRLLESLSKMDPSLAGLLTRLRDTDTELDELSMDLDRHLDGIEADPARLTRLEERLAVVERLRRKYGSSEQEILDYRDGIAAELSELAGDDQRGEALSVARREAEEALRAAAARLSSGRKKAARKLSRLVEAELKELAMASSRFEVKLHPHRPGGDSGGASEGADLPCGPNGAETPEFLFSANEGEPPRPLRKVASGGELSRLFLAIKNALRQAASGMVLVFDEVDAGVGGGVAERVGRALAELARDHQVLCITHLPQIAAFADVHFRVAKGRAKGRTVTRIERLDADARVEELARMAGGEKVTETTRAHARDLLKSRAVSR